MENDIANFSDTHKNTFALLSIMPDPARAVAWEKTLCFA